MKTIPSTLMHRYSSIIDNFIDKDSSLPDNVFYHKPFFYNLIKFDTLFDKRLYLELSKHFDMNGSLITSIMPDYQTYKIQSFLTERSNGDDLLDCLYVDFNAFDYLPGVSMNYFTLSDIFIIINSKFFIYCNREFEIAILATKKKFVLDDELLSDKINYIEQLYSMYYDKKDAEDFYSKLLQAYSGAVI